MNPLAAPPNSSTVAKPLAEYCMKKSPGAGTCVMMARAPEPERVARIVAPSIVAVALLETDMDTDVAMLISSVALGSTKTSTEVTLLGAIVSGTGGKTVSMALFMDATEHER